MSMSTDPIELMALLFSFFFIFIVLYTFIYCCLYGLYKPWESAYTPKTHQQLLWCLCSVCLIWSFECIPIVAFTFCNTTFCGFLMQIISRSTLFYCDPHCAMNTVLYWYVQWYLLIFSFLVPVPDSKPPTLYSCFFVLFLTYGTYVCLKAIYLLHSWRSSQLPYWPAKSLASFCPQPCCFPIKSWYIHTFWGCWCMEQYEFIMVHILMIN